MSDYRPLGAGANPDAIHAAGASAGAYPLGPPANLGGLAASSGFDVDTKGLRDLSTQLRTVKDDIDHITNSLDDLVTKAVSAGGKLKSAFGQGGGAGQKTTTPSGFSNPPANTPGQPSSQSGGPKNTNTASPFSGGLGKSVGLAAAGEVAAQWGGGINSYMNNLKSGGMAIDLQTRIAGGIFGGTQTTGLLGSGVNTQGYTGGLSQGQADVSQAAATQAGNARLFAGPNSQRQKQLQSFTNTMLKLNPGMSKTQATQFADTLTSGPMMTAFQQMSTQGASQGGLMRPFNAKTNPGGLNNPNQVFSTLVKTFFPGHPDMSPSAMKQLAGSSPNSIASWTNIAAKFGQGGTSGANLTTDEINSVRQYMAGSGNLKTAEAAVGGSVASSTVARASSKAGLQQNVFESSAGAQNLSNQIATAAQNFASGLAKDNPLIVSAGVAFAGAGAAALALSAKFLEAKALLTGLGGIGGGGGIGGVGAAGEGGLLSKIAGKLGITGAGGAAAKAGTTAAAETGGADLATGALGSGAGVVGSAGTGAAGAAGMSSALGAAPIAAVGAYAGLVYTNRKKIASGQMPMDPMSQFQDFFAKHTGQMGKDATSLFNQAKKDPYGAVGIASKVVGGAKSIGSDILSAVGLGDPVDEMGDPPTGATSTMGLSPTMAKRVSAMQAANPNIKISSGHRTSAQQATLYRLKGGKGVAKPGQSTHQKGLAADVGPPSQFGWIAKNAAKYGLGRPAPKSEPWHLQAMGDPVSPVGAGLTLGRTDQGVDYSGAGPVYAVGAGTILSTSNSGWPGGAFIALKLDNPPDAAHSIVYYAEDITPSVSVGQHVSAGQVIGQATGGSSGIEIGWGSSALGQPLNQAENGVQSGATQEGQNFLNYITGAAMSGGSSSSSGGGGSGGSGGGGGASTSGSGTAATHNVSLKTDFNASVGGTGWLGSLSGSSSTTGSAGTGGGSTGASPSAPASNVGGGTSAASGPPATGQMLEFFKEVNQGIGAKDSSNTINDETVWQQTEGGWTNNPDMYNPWGTTLPMGGSHGTNSANVQNYPTFAAGVQASISMINQSNMAPIKAALVAGAPLSAFEAAVSSTQWGTTFSAGDPIAGMGDPDTGFAGALAATAPMAAPVARPSSGPAAAGSMPQTVRASMGSGRSISINMPLQVISATAEDAQRVANMVIAQIRESEGQTQVAGS